MVDVQVESKEYYLNEVRDGFLGDVYYEEYEEGKKRKKVNAQADALRLGATDEEVTRAALGWFRRRKSEVKKEGLSFLFGYKDFDPYIKALKAGEPILKGEYSHTIFVKRSNDNCEPLRELTDKEYNEINTMKQAYPQGVMHGGEKRTLKNCSIFYINGPIGTKITWGDLYLEKILNLELDGPFYVLDEHRSYFDVPINARIATTDTSRNNDTTRNTLEKVIPGLSNHYNWLSTIQPKEAQLIDADYIKLAAFMVFENGTAHPTGEDGRARVIRSKLKKIEEERLKTITV